MRYMSFLLDSFAGVRGCREGFHDAKPVSGKFKATQHVSFVSESRLSALASAGFRDKASAT